MKDTVQEAVENLVNAIRASLRDDVLAALAPGVAAEAARVKPRNASAAPRANGRAKGEKRPPEELEILCDQLLEAVKAQPSERIEQIAERMDVPTRELNLPMKKLIARKLVKATGEKRATRYTATARA